MSTSEQGLSITGLLGSAGAAANGTATAPTKTDNPQKNKEFSSALGRAQETQNAVAGKSAGTEGAAPVATPQQSEAPVVVDDAEIALFFSRADGNALPLNGQVLPPALADRGRDAEGEAAISLPLQSEEEGSGFFVSLATTALTPETTGDSETATDDADTPIPVTGLQAPMANPVTPTASTTSAGGTDQPAPVNPPLTAGAGVTQAPAADDKAPERVIFTTPGQLHSQSLSDRGDQAELARQGPLQRDLPVSAAATAAVPGQLSPAAQLALQLAGENRGKAPLNSSAVAATDSAGAASSGPALTPLNGFESARPVVAATAPASIPVDVGRPGFSDQVMQRVMWMSSQHISKAEIALDPPELGPLQVKISSQGDQMTVHFTSSHGVVRDALDQGLPRLRDLMDQQGLNLVDVDVSDQNMQRQAGGEERDAGGDVGSDAVVASEGGDAPADSLQPSADTSAMVSRALGLVDHYV